MFKRIGCCIIPLLADLHCEIVLGAADSILLKFDL